MHQVAPSVFAAFTSQAPETSSATISLEVRPPSGTGSRLGIRTAFVASMTISPAHRRLATVVDSFPDGLSLRRQGSTRPRTGDQSRNNLTGGRPTEVPSRGGWPTGGSGRIPCRPPCSGRPSSMEMALPVTAPGAVGRRRRGGLPRGVARRGGQFAAAVAVLAGDVVPRTSPPRARRTGRADGGRCGRACSRAGRGTSRNSRRAHSARNAAGATTTRRSRGIRRSPGRSAATVGSISMSIDT